MKEFNCVFQYDAMQCGAACLTMVCNYFGIDCSLTDISQLCPANAEGVSLYGLKKTAEKLGFIASCVKITVDSLIKEKMPAILHWNQNHFVVLYKVKNGTFYISDPSKGNILMNRTEFEEHWNSILTETSNKGVAMFISPGYCFKTNIQFNTKKNKNSTFHFIAKYVKQYKNWFSQIIFGLLIGCALQLIMPFLTQSIVDVGIKYHNLPFIWLILIGELMVVIGKTITDFLRRWLMLHISMRINISLVSDFFIKLLKLPMSYFDTKQQGDLLQRINDHSRIQSFLTTHLPNVILTIFSFFIFGIVLFIYHHIIFLIFIGGSVIYAIWISYFLSKRKILDYELFSQQAKNQSKTIQFISSIQEIKLHDCEKRKRWEWEDVQADLFQIQIKSLKLQQRQEAGAVLISEVKNIFITVFSATSVVNGFLTLGEMIAIQYIIGQLNSPVEQLMSFLYSLQDMKISLERINDIHQQINEESDVCKKESKFSNHGITLRNISFKYDKFAENYILDNISAHIPHAKVTAIVGASGSGKTTLMKLLLGFYNVNGGEIIIGTENISSYNIKSWRNHCGVVMQNGVIFSDSIARNIAADDYDIDEQRLKYAANIANIHDYINSLPLKYNTRIGQDGVGISQGQKQRILIAKIGRAHV